MGGMGDPVLLLQSRVDAVAVHRAGAIVTRVAELPNGGGRRVKLGPLPLAIDDASLRVAVTGDGNTLVATDLWVTLEVPTADATLPATRPEDVEAAEQRVAVLRDRLEHVRRDVARIESIGAVARPATKPGREPPKSPAEARMALLSLRERRLTALDDQQEHVARDLREAERRLSELYERERRSSSARHAEAHELRKAVVVSLSGEPDGSAQLELSYRVSAARWAPTYVMRIDGDMKRASLEVRAAVCQRSGEDWEGVTLSLSTAELSGWAELPELPSIRIGRRQSRPARPGWRPPPTGVEALFADYDRFRTRGQAPGEERPLDRPESSADEPATARRMVEWDESELAASVSPPLAQRASKRKAPPPPPGPPPSVRGPTGAPTPPLGSHPVYAPQSPSYAPQSPSAPQSPYAPQSPSAPAAPGRAPESVAASKSGGVFGAISGAMGAAVDALAEIGAPGGGAGPAVGRARRGSAAAGVDLETANLAASEEMLDYMQLHLPSSEGVRRGRLVRRTRRELYLALIEEEHLSVDLGAAMTHVEQETRRCLEAALPAGCRRLMTSGYDYVYPAEARVNAASDGVFHNIPLSRRSTATRARFIVVPRETRDAFRFIEMTNPLDAPLLDGPLDVYVGEDFLLTSELNEVAPRALLRVGLGVEQRLKVSRNTRFVERSGGLIGGRLDLIHRVEVELDNQLPREAEVEVRERVPVTREDADDIRVAIGDVEPPWEDWEPEDPDERAGLDGGRRWRLTVPRGEKRRMSAEYTVRIASKHELSGGNRRED